MHKRSSYSTSNANAVLLLLAILYSQFSTVLKNCLAILSCASEPFSVGVSPMARMTCEVES